MTTEYIDHGIVTDTRSLYARRIKEARKRAKLTQKELAEKSGLSYIAIRRIENGERSPRLDDIQKINRVLRPDYDPLDSQTQSFPNDWSEEQTKEHVQILNEHSAKRERQIRLLSNFDKLNEDGQEKAIELVELVTHIPEWKLQK